MEKTMQNTKSATTAGLLGIFLGAVGAHNWYLGEKNKGIIHVCRAGGGLLVDILVGAILPAMLSWDFYDLLGLWMALQGIGNLAMVASGVWGLVEGIMLLAQGDAGLAAKGYAVATAPAMMGQGMQQPMGGYGQPMQPQMGMQQGMGYGQPGVGMQQPMGQQMPMQPQMGQMPQQGMGMEQPMQPAQPVQPQMPQQGMNQDTWQNGQ